LHFPIDHRDFANPSRFRGVVAGQRACFGEGLCAFWLTPGDWWNRPSGVDERRSDGLRVRSWRRPVIHSALTLTSLGEHQLARRSRLHFREYLGIEFGATQDLIGVRWNAARDVVVVHAGEQSETFRYEFIRFHESAA